VLRGLYRRRPSPSSWYSADTAEIAVSAEVITRRATGVHAFNSKGARIATGLSTWFQSRPPLMFVEKAEDNVIQSGGQRGPVATGCMALMPGRAWAPCLPVALRSCLAEAEGTGKRYPPPLKDDAGAKKDHCLFCSLHLDGFVTSTSTGELACPRSQTYRPSRHCWLDRTTETRTTVRVMGIRRLTDSSDCTCCFDPPFIAEELCRMHEQQPGRGGAVHVHITS
jgi:hypothetical protein